jgi:Tol biopolymer transport system component
MDADGALPRPLLPRIEPAAVGAGAPAWSPDGDAIAFVEGRSGQLLLRVVRVADGATLALVEGDMPAWSPDGRHIAFVSQSDDQDRDIHMMRRDGVARRRLTDHPADDWLPRWTVHAPPHHP